MIRRSTALLMALLLMGAFYLYALMREDSQAKRSDQWMVTGEDASLEPSGGLQSTDGASLAAAMGSLLPLPASLTSASVEDSSYHGYYARILRATDGLSLVLGVRPASASPLIREKDLDFSHSDKTLLGYPLLAAADETHSFYYLVTDTAAFVLRLPREGETEALRGFLISQP
ncbi:MAG: hypothetical protein AB9880_06265 [Christensenellales bacterium]